MFDIDFTKDMILEQQNINAYKDCQNILKKLFDKNINMYEVRFQLEKILDKKDFYIVNKL